ncbi:hypothetical protein ABEW19_23120 [Paenibacillus illinoisensis]|uniref:hypothetical protein n=1 Tax=Paenibacillus illinoisensis TaxID=59845 RepID=UPI003D2D54A3
MSDEAFAELWDGYYQHDAMQKGLDTEFNFKGKGGSAGGSVGLRRSIPQASGPTSPEVNTSPSSSIVPKVKTFVQKYWEDSQKMGIVSGGGSHWSNNKKNKTGEAASGGGKAANSETGSTSKPGENPSKPKQNSESTPSSKTNELMQRQRRKIARHQRRILEKYNLINSKSLHKRGRLWSDGLAYLFYILKMTI